MQVMEQVSAIGVAICRCHNNIHFTFFIRVSVTKIAGLFVQTQVEYTSPSAFQFICEPSQ